MTVWNIYQKTPNKQKHPRTMKYFQIKSNILKGCSIRFHFPLMTDSVRQCSDNLAYRHHIQQTQTVTRVYLQGTTKQGPIYSKQEIKAVFYEDSVLILHLKTTFTHCLTIAIRQDMSFVYISIHRAKENAYNFLYNTFSCHRLDLMPRLCNAKISISRQ